MRHSQARAVSDGVQGRDLFHRFGKVAPSLPQIVRHLHPQPDVRAVSAQLPQADRHLGRDSRTFGENGVQCLARDAQVLRSSRYRQPQGWQYVFAEELSGVTGSPSRRSFDTIFSHIPAHVKAITRLERNP
jgi:hypothetical protein